MKKKRKTSLDVDFIGGAVPLTENEEKMISEFIRMSKSKSEKTVPRRPKSHTKKKAA